MCEEVVVAYLNYPPAPSLRLLAGVKRRADASTLTKLHQFINNPVFFIYILKTEQNRTKKQTNTATL